MPRNNREMRGGQRDRASGFQRLTVTSEAPDASQSATHTEKKFSGRSKGGNDAECSSRCHRMERVTAPLNWPLEERYSLSSTPQESTRRRCASKAMNLHSRRSEPSARPLRRSACHRSRGPGCTRSCRSARRSCRRRSGRWRWRVCLGYRSSPLQKNPSKSNEGIRSGAGKRTTVF